MKRLINNPLIAAIVLFSTAAILIVLTPRHPEFRWIGVAMLGAVALSLGMAVRRGLRQSAAETANLIANIPVAASGLSMDYSSTVDGRGPLFDPVRLAVRSAAEDITRERARSEESRHQLEVLLEGMQDAVLGVDPAGRVQWSNGPMRRLMHSDSGGGSVRHGQALVHTLRDPALLAAVQNTLDARTATECRSEYLLPGRIFHVNASPLPGGGAVVVLRDRTEAEEMERTQRDFVANVSHELRTPLTSIVGYVETVIDHENLSPPAREFLDTVLKNASRMHRLTEDLLLLARVEQAEHPLDFQPVSAEQLLREALQTVSGSAYAEGAKFEVAACTDREVLADENAIQQVLGNLLENAVKYSGGRSNPPHVTVSAIEHPDAGTVEFRVADNGPGIPSEHLPRIFERFYRVEKARSRATGGTGLGLSIARHLIEQHGGRIWAESTLGQGSTFLFTLPAAD